MKSKTFIPRLSHRETLDYGKRKYINISRDMKYVTVNENGNCIPVKGQYLKDEYFWHIRTIDYDVEYQYYYTNEIEEEDADLTNGRFSKAINVYPQTNHCRICLPRNNIIIGAFLDVMSNKPITSCNVFKSIKKYYLTDFEQITYEDLNKTFGQLGEEGRFFGSFFIKPKTVTLTKNRHLKSAGFI